MNLEKLLPSILKEWSTRVSHGGSEWDSTDEADMYHLRQVMLEHGIPLTVANRWIKNLNEQEDDDEDRDRDRSKSSDISDEAERKGLVHLGYGNYGPGEDEPATHKSKDGKLVPLSAEEKRDQEEDEEETEEEKEKEQEDKEKEQELEQEREKEEREEEQEREEEIKKAEEVGGDGKVQPEGEGEQAPDYPPVEYELPEEIVTVREENDQSLNKFMELGFSEAEGAPGNAASMYNEILSGKVAEVLIENPDYDEEDLVRYAMEQYGEGGLAEENTGTSPAGYLRVKDLPDDLPKEHRGLYSKTLLAVRNGQRKARKSRQVMANLGWDDDNVETISFFGDRAGLEAQIETVKSVHKVVTTDEYGKKIEVDKDEIIDLIKKSGIADNPSDTAVISINKKTSEASVLFFSDKDSPYATVSQSTQVAELVGDDAKSVVDNLVKNDIIDEDVGKKIMEERKKAADDIDKIEKQLKGITNLPANKLLKDLTKGEDEGQYDPEEIINSAKHASGGSKPDKYWRKAAVNKFGKPFEGDPRISSGEFSSNAQFALQFLPDRDDGTSYEDEPPTEEEMLMAFMKMVSDDDYVKTKNDQKVLAQIQKDHNIVDDEEMADRLEEIRKETLDREVKMLDKLNKTTIKLGDIEIGAGTIFEAENIWGKGHFEAIQGEHGVHKYPNMFEVNMSGFYADKKVLSECLGGVTGKDEFIAKFEIGQGSDIVGTRKAKKLTFGRTTGRSRLVYAIVHGEGGEQKRIPIMDKRIRSKNGPLGKLETVYDWTNDMRKCMMDKTRQFEQED